MKILLCILPCVVALALVWHSMAAPAREVSSEIGPVNVRLTNPDGSPSPLFKVPRVERTDAEWMLRLSPAEYRVARAQGTERAFCGVFHDNHKRGLYSCIGCGLPLFRSDAKFESGTGWPSFFQPFASENIGTTRDHSHGMVREEIHCVRCQTHLGHVFHDGPAPTGLRYCVNSAALAFEESAPAPGRETIFFGVRDVRNVESAVAKLPGVLATQVGSMSGRTAKATSLEARADATGYAGVVRVEYDPRKIALQDLVKVFLDLYEPRHQSPDTGKNEDAVLLFTRPGQELAIRTAVANQLQAGHEPVLTRIDLAGPFQPTGEDHPKDR